MPTRLTELLRMARVHTGTVWDAIRVLERAHLPSTPAAAQRMLEKAADLSELNLDASGTFRLAGIEPDDTSGHRKAAGGSADWPGADLDEGPDGIAGASTGSVRIIAVDVEAAVRSLVEDKGKLTRRIWQLGGIRFGTDQDWVTAAPRFDHCLRLPEPYTVPEHKAEAHAERAEDATVVLSEFATWAADADILVAYNGNTLDFPALDDAYAAAGIEPPTAARVDGLYLAYCLWPTATTHQLTKLMDQLRIPRHGQVHDASDDATVLARLLEHGAAQFALTEPDLRALLAAVTDSSVAWRMLRSLHPDLARPAGHVRAADVGQLLHTKLSVQERRRGRIGSRLTVPDELRDGSRVTPHALATALHGTGVEQRPAQQQVTDAIEYAGAVGIPALIEAPTGTGKSLSALAAALNWLADDPTHTVIISTYTKQLQSQLATELSELAQAVPGLLDTTDVVKGSTNRMSLRGLTYTLADSTGADIGRAASVVRYTDLPEFRELLAYLLLRLVDGSTAKTSRWVAHSVDPADMPAFFQSYSGPHLPGWLASLSQAAHGEWPDPAAIPVAAWTDEVREALDGHRLVIANHALLLSHWEDLSDRADSTLVIADEAHALEGAATDALSASLAATTVDDVLGQVQQVLADLSGTGATGSASAAHRDLTSFWAQGRFRRVLSRLLDSRVGQANVGGRSLTIISPFTGEYAARDARPLVRVLHQTSGQIGRLLHGLAELREQTIGALDPFEEQRLSALTLRVAALRTEIDNLHDTIGAFLPIAPQAAVQWTRTDDNGSGGPRNTHDDRGNSGDAATSHVVPDDDPEDAGPGTTEPTQSDAGDEEPDRVAGADQDDGTGGGPDADQGLAAPQMPDRVVYAHEIGELDRRGLAHYRIELTASPIELPKDLIWQQLCSTFRRLALLSATLTVHTPGADPWTYTRTRLGLPDAMEMLVEGPFDYATQARLFALEDFPSWAEQPKQAMRTVAHQLAGYTREITRQYLSEFPPADRGADPTELHCGPWMHGAMVLTTSRNAAGGIADELGILHAAEGRGVPVHNQVIVGTRTAVNNFKGDEDWQGGVLVGTRGLWTGVDISERGRNHLVWINKLPFPVFTDPVIAARREAIRRRAERAGEADPDMVATATYYLPLAALDLRQAVGRLIRNSSSRGAVIISDRKLAGDLPLRRLYREVFLGSLDRGLHIPDADTGEPTGANVVTMRDAWAQLWPFFAGIGALPEERVAELTTVDELEKHTLLPATLEIRRLQLTDEEVTEHIAADTFVEEVLTRCERVATLLAGEPRTLNAEQRQAIEAVATGRDSLALLPTGHGKSFCYQLPALVLPGVTVVVSPLISLMHDQALGLNHTIGGAVRALVSSLPESVSRAGRTEVVEALSGDTRHGIKLVYVSPERLAQARFRQALQRGVGSGALRRVAIDEAHTYVQWGEDFRPSFRRAGALLRQLRTDNPGALTLQALTATATPTVEQSLREEVLIGLIPELTSDDGLKDGPGQPVIIRANPLRPELTLGRRVVRAGNRRSMAALAEQVIDAETGHTIIYCLTVKDVDWLHAHLRDFLDGRPVALRKFHGRLSEVEKASVSLEFKEAAPADEDEHARMVIVATSAFGLGVDRKDVRSVLCATPPTDLAALYQQLGRGGRDVAGTSVNTLDVTTHALAFATERSLGTAAWMAALDLDASLLTRFGHAALRAARRGHLDSSASVDAMLQCDVDCGRMTEREASEQRLRQQWAVGLTRAIAALADLGALVDTGDVPAVVSVGAGIRPVNGALPTAVAAAILALPQRGAALSRDRVPLNGLHRLLLADPACTAAGYRNEVPGLAELWLLLCDLHDWAYLDVSQRPNDRMLVTIRLTNAIALDGSNAADREEADDGTTVLPDMFATRVQGKLARAQAEATHLQAFFSNSRRCLNARLADYFSVDVPTACCSTDRVKCSVCAGAADGPGTEPGTPLHALVNGILRPQAVDAATRAARLDNSIQELLRATFNGLTARYIHHVLTGKTRVWIARLGNYRYMPHHLRDTLQHGQHPSVSLGEVDASIDRLRTAGVVGNEGIFIRTTANIARGARRQAGNHVGPGRAASVAAPATAP